jgi:peptidyl-prolyl cis-trans isomerase C
MNSLHCFVRVLAPALVFVASAHLAGAQTASRAIEGDPVVAAVDGKEIHLSEVVEAQRGLPEQYRQAPFEVIFPTMLERLNDHQLVVAEGRKAGLQNDASVKQRVMQLEDRVIREAYLVRHVDKAVTEEMLRERYDVFTKETPAEEEVRARHILLESEEEAKTVIEQIKGGIDFAEVAKEKSTGPSAAQGGDIGYFNRNSVVPEFAEVAFGLQPGEMSDAPVKTAFGWHVVKVEDRRIADPPSFEEARERLAAEASEEAVVALITSLRGAAAIERFNPDGTPASNSPPNATSE